jgi:hypothetical protein
MSGEATRTDLCPGSAVPARRPAIRLLIAEDVCVLRDTLVALRPTPSGRALCTSG